MSENIGGIGSQLYGVKIRAESIRAQQSDVVDSLTGYQAQLAGTQESFDEIFAASQIAQDSARQAAAQSRIANELIQKAGEIAGQILGGSHDDDTLDTINSVTRLATERDKVSYYCDLVENNMQNIAARSMIVSQRLGEIATDVSGMADDSQDSVSTAESIVDALDQYIGRL